MYTVIGKASNRGLRVLWMLEELGQDYTHVNDGPHSETVRKHSILGKVPVLLDGDDAIRDSSAILTYLADKHGALTAPAGTIARGQQDAVTHMILDDIEALLWMAARHSFILPEEERVPEIRPALRTEFARNIDKFAKVFAQNGGPFVMGGEMTITDIIAGHCLNWAANAKFAVEDEALLAYGARMREREAFKRAAAK